MQTTIRAGFVRIPKITQSVKSVSNLQRGMSVLSENCLV